MAGRGEDRREEARRARLALRVGTEERERAVSELRRHYADGRLTSDELEDRCREAYGARTAGDLVRLLHDLPALEPRLPARRDEPDRSWTTPFVAIVIALPALLLMLGSGAGVRLLPLLVLLVLAVLAVLAVRRAS